MLYFYLFRAAEQAIEALSVLIALRRAPEGPQNTGRFSLLLHICSNEVKCITLLDKRAKRHRGSSPLSTPGTPIPALNGKVAFNARPDRDRASEGPNGIPYQSYKMEPKARKKFYDKQFPLQEGRKVAFHPPKTPTTADENAWILAIITRCLNQEKNRSISRFLIVNLALKFDLLLRYEVQDAEPQEDGQSGQYVESIIKLAFFCLLNELYRVYSGTIKNMVPLPDIEAPFNHMSHPNQYPVFATGSTVLALYPDTSCFYRAEVIEVLPGGRDTQTGKVSIWHNAVYYVILNLCKQGISITIRR